MPKIKTKQKKTAPTTSLKSKESDIIKSYKSLIIACVRACMCTRACVCMCVRAYEYVRACVRVSPLSYFTCLLVRVCTAVQSTQSPRRRWKALHLQKLVGCSLHLNTKCILTSLSSTFSVAFYMQFSDVRKSGIPNGDGYKHTLSL